MLLSRIAGAFSKSGDWPCDEGTAPLGSVIILSAKDDAADTIVPRLIAAEADLKKIHIVPAVRRLGEDGQRTFNLQLDLPALEESINKIGDVRLVEIDPIYVLLGEVDSHRKAKLRSVLEPLGALASTLRRDYHRQHASEQGCRGKCK
jgi:putative DNA primase/helicase